MNHHEVRVLAIASHVTYGYVGNKTATLVLQLFGADVSAIHTVHFSNHTAYRSFTGRRVSASEIQELYDGLVSSDLVDFDVLLSGYTGSADAVRTVGNIALDLKRRRGEDFFWILDPVMGDSGKLYVADDIPPVYRNLAQHADMILPNAFELEQLVEAPVNDLTTAVNAVAQLHVRYGVKHVVVTSMRLNAREASLAHGSANGDDEQEALAIIGSSSTASGTARPFLLTIPLLPIFFSGTGDMFAALLAVRFREACLGSGTSLNGPRTASADNLPACETPLARAVQKVLASMYAILVKTAKGRDDQLTHMEPLQGGREDVERREHLRRTKISEVRVASFADELKHPPSEVDGVKFQAKDVYEILNRLK